MVRAQRAAATPAPVKREFFLTGSAEYCAHVEATSEAEALKLAARPSVRWTRSMNLPLRDIVVSPIDAELQALLDDDTRD
jgi:hypothetical protein